MNDINFDITKHWLPVGEKQGSIEKDTLTHIAATRYVTP